MADSEIQGFKADIEDVLDEFAARKNLLEAFCTRTKSLIEASLQDANIPYQSVQTRVKTEKKIRDKYSDPAKDYRRLSDITDLAGLRVITYYEDDIDRVAELIKREFTLDQENSVDKRHGEPDRFGYSALNYVCWHLERRTSDVEYRKFEGVRCEIQITSILRHAWSEMEHEWYDLREAYPNSVKRRFYRIASLLELAESEFLDIKKSRTQYQKSVAVQVEANVPDIPIDIVSLRSFIERDPLVAELDAELAKILDRPLVEAEDRVIKLRLSAASRAGMTKLQDIRAALKQYGNALPEYLRRCRSELWHGRTAGAHVARGVSIHHVTMLLTNLQGVEATAEYLKALGRAATWDLALQVAIAREVAAKHPS
jgi:putative GTP pyrophosphokinase